MQRIVIWGASGHALVVASAIRLGAEYMIAGFLDDTRPIRDGEEFGGAPVLGRGEQLPRLWADGFSHLIVAIGDNSARLRLSALAEAEGFALATVIHPGAIVAPDVAIGRGSVVLAGAVINPGARVGANVIVNTSASVDHECEVRDGAHIGPGARLGGRVVVERGAWIGIGATVKDRVSIGAGSIVGAGAVVVRDIPPGVVAYGVPARVQRMVDQDERQDQTH